MPLLLSKINIYCIYDGMFIEENSKVQQLNFIMHIILVTFVRKQQEVL